MKPVYIIDTLRTPFGSFGGSLSDVPAPKLAAAVIEKLIERNPIEGKDVSEVIIGQVITGGAGQAVARQAMRFAELPDQVHALTVNKVCGSGLKAIMLGAGSIRLGDSELVIAGGMENMSMSPYALTKARFGHRLGNVETTDLLVNDALQDPYSGQHMGLITEAIVTKQELTREEQDAFTVRSYKLAQKAIETGIFKEEITPVIKKTRKGDVVVDQDEEPSRVDFDRLSTLRPVFKKDGSVTAGNASTINDGAALSLLASEEAVEKYGLKPIAKLISYATHSMHPDLFAEAPVGAIEKAVAKAGLTLADIDLFEINEAFAAVSLIAIKNLNLDEDKVNVNGGAIAIGHPVGASGGRLATTLIRELHRRKQRYGLATLCIGGGEAVAAIFERV